MSEIGNEKDFEFRTSEKQGAFWKVVFDPHAVPWLGHEEEPQCEEVAITADWKIRIGTEAGEMTFRAARELAGFLGGGLRAPFKITKVSPSQLVKPNSNCIDLIITQSSIRKKSVESYSIDVSRGKDYSGSIRILSKVPSGTLAGVFYLEELLRRRRGPFLNTGTTVHTPKLSQRVVFREEIEHTLPASAKNRPAAELRDFYYRFLASRGINGVTFQALPYYQMYISEESLKKAIEIYCTEVEAAARWGIKVYLYYCQIDICKIGGGDENQPSLFKKCANLQGVAVKRHGSSLTDDEVPGHYICSGKPEGIDYYTRPLREVLENVVGLAGVLILYEGLASCDTAYTDPRYEGKIVSDCPICAQRDHFQGVADLFNAIEEAVHESSAQAEMVLWIYNWDVFLFHSSQESPEPVIEKMSNQIILMPTVDQGGTVTTAGGMKKELHDYTWLNTTLPDYFKMYASIAKKLGFTLWAMTEFQRTWDVGGAAVPCHPCYGLVYAKQKAKNSSGEFGEPVIGALESYTPLMPSTASDLYYWYSWKREPEESFDDWLKETACVRFGRAGETLATRAWKIFDRAIRFHPHRPGRDYRPSLHAPATVPLFLDFAVEKRLAADVGQALYPYLEEEEFSQFEKMLPVWEEGVNILRTLAEQVPETYRVEAEKELAIASSILYNIETVINIQKFLQLRIDVKESQGEEQKQAVNSLKKIFQRELDLCKLWLRLLEVDSRIGMAGFYHWHTTPAKIHTKIKILKQELKTLVNL